MINLIKPHDLNFAYTMIKSSHLKTLLKMYNYNKFICIFTKQAPFTKQGPIEYEFGYGVHTTGMATPHN